MPVFLEYRTARTADVPGISGEGRTTAQQLLRVMPPEGSQSLAAAGLQGANSSRSIASAFVMASPRNRDAAITSFMVD